MGTEGKTMRSFGPFRLDIEKRLLLRNGTSVPIPPKEIEILCRLAEKPGELVTKKDLIEAVWPDSFVEESNLSRHIYVLRKLFSDLGYQETLIENVPKRGYRLVGTSATVDAIDGGPDEKTDLRQPATSRSASSEPVSGHLPTAVGAKSETAKSIEHSIARPELPHDAYETFSWASRWYLITAALVVVVGGGLWIGREYIYSTPVDRTEAVRSIAVLNFTTAADDIDSAYIGHGMSETLIQKLSRNRQIVVKRATFPGTPQAGSVDLIEIGRRLRVDAVLDGGIQRTSDRVRVTARLVRVGDGTTIWDETYEEPLTDLFKTQDSISEQVFAALSIELTGSERAALRKRGTRNAEAEQLYQRARFFWNKRTKEGFLRSIELFEQAIVLDPSFPHPHSGIADAYLLLGDYGYLSPRDSMVPAMSSATAALRLDGELAEAHTSLAYAHFLYDWDRAAAEASFRRAIEIDPNYSTLRLWYAEYLLANGRGDEARANIEAAQALEPQSPSIVAVSCWMRYMERQYQQALEMCDAAIEMDPNLSTAYFWKGQASELLGLFGPAIEEYRKALAIAPESSEVIASLGHALGKSGDRSGAVEILDQLNDRSKTAYVSAYFIALVHIGIGDRQAALRELKRSIGERSRAVPYFHIDPMLEELRDNPEFIDLIHSAARAR